MLRVWFGTGLIALLAALHCAAGETEHPVSQPAPLLPRLSPELSPQFDRWVNELLSQWQVAGVAIGVVKQGQVWTGAYGYRDVENKLPLTPQTVMPIASVTKSFTAVLLAQLVEDALLDWDQPVIHYLPDFQLRDTYATRHLRVRDLMTHVSGLPGHNGLWIYNDLSRAEFVRRLRYLEPAASFREKTQYQNFMYVTAGYLAEVVTGKSWETLIAERIFKPLGMARANTTVAQMLAQRDFARPYTVSGGKRRRVSMRSIPSMAPAGAINASVEAMLPYLEARMSAGLVSARSEAFMQKPHAVRRVSPGAPDYPELGVDTYGIGVRVSDFRGHKWVFHPGGIDGFTARINWLPDSGIGFIVLSNSDGEAKPVGKIISYRLLDELLGYAPVDWNARLQQARKAPEQRRTLPVRNTRPSHPLAAYTGHYSHPGYGEIEIRAPGTHLDIHFGRFTATLEHYHYDVFIADDTLLVRFNSDNHGAIDEIALPLEPAVADIRFRRIPN